MDGWKEIYASYGQEFPLQVWIRDVVGTTDSTFDPAAYLADLTGCSLDTASLHARVNRYHLEQLDALSAMPGVVDYLETARPLACALLWLPALPMPGWKDT